MQHAQGIRPEEDIRLQRIFKRSWAWWCTPVILTLERLREED
jgi:hypothetical protein